MPEKELRLIKTLWGIDDPISPDLFQSIKNEGYYGVEVIRLAWLFDRKGLIESLNTAKLAAVCQMHTAGGFLSESGGGEYIYCGAYDVAEHKADFQKQLKECMALLNEVDAGGFINVHAGVDAWSVEEATDFLSFCLEEIDKCSPGMTVTFETHRQRLFGSPFQTRQILAAMSSSSSLKLNADLSHWYCACERVFNQKEARDAVWWPAVLKMVGERCHYIHARFGWAQGPQMADPSAAECESDCQLQLDVWKYLIEQQQQRKMQGSEGAGDCVSFVSPEYGPAPYLAAIPHTQKPVASLPAAVAYTKGKIEELFEQI